MSDRERLPDEALVVRCGLPPFRNSPLDRGSDHHPDGPYGFSVQPAPGLTMEQLATACRNNSVGFITVGEIRRMGYDVIPTRGEAHHATVTVPSDWSPEAADQLACLFQHAKSPSPKR